MTIKTFKKLFKNLIVVSGGKDVKVDLISEKNLFEPIAKYKDIVEFIVEDTFDDLKLNTNRGAFLFIATHHIEIYVK